MEIYEIKSKLEKLDKYKENSINIITSSIKNINNTLFGSDKINIDDYFDFSPIYKYIIGLKSNNQKTYAYALNVLMSLSDNAKLKNVYKRIYTNIARKIDSDRTFQKPSTSEKSMFKSWNAVLQLRKSLLNKFKKSNDPADFYDYYIVSLFTYIPPLRPQELCSSTVVKTIPQGKVNFYLSPKHELHINEYKTEKSLGKRIIEIPNVLHNIIMKFNNKYVLPICDGSKQNTSAGVCNHFRRVTGMTPSLLRKIYISELMDNDPTPEKRKSIAHIMGHSVATQVLIYTKFSKTIHGNK